MSVYPVKLPNRSYMEAACDTFCRFGGNARLDGAVTYRAQMARHDSQLAHGEIRIRDPTASATRRFLGFSGRIRVANWRLIALATLGPQF